MNIKAIIENHKEQMRSAGLLREAGAAQLSPQVAALRPSLTKVNRALTENPDLLRGQVKPSPFQILFEYTLPKLEPLLIEMGEEGAERIIGRLCQFGQEVVKKYGAEAGEHLGLYKDMFNCRDKVGQADGLEAIINAYCKMELEGNAVDYFNLMLGPKLRKLDTDGQGMLSVDLDFSAKEEDMAVFVKAAITNIKELCLSDTSMSDAALAGLTRFPNLQILFLSIGQINGPGVAHLSQLKELKELWLIGSRISYFYLKRLPCLPQVEELRLQGPVLSMEEREKLKLWFPKARIL